MKSTVRIGLIGDYDVAVLAHQAIPIALRLAADAVATAVKFEWMPTEEIREVGQVSLFDGVWCVPASPYRSMDGALLAIRCAREQNRPFLGTCGGFQHAIIEYARNVLGWADADHAETAPDAGRPVIAPLKCMLVGTTGMVRLRAGSRIAEAYGRDEAPADYRCRYGLNPEFQALLASGLLRIGAEDVAGEVRAVELDDHAFFVATLFQPELAALKGQLSPLVTEFIRSCIVNVAQQRAPADAP